MYIYILTVTDTIHSYYTSLNVQIYKPTSIFVSENFGWRQHGWMKRSEIFKVVSPKLCNYDFGMWIFYNTI